MAWMREQGCYIQWYDSINDDGGVSYRNEFNSQNSHWVQDEIYGRVTDSIWLKLLVELGADRQLCGACRRAGAGSL